MACNQVILGRAPLLFQLECESWQPLFEPGHLIRCPFDADNGGT